MRKKKLYTVYVVGRGWVQEARMSYAPSTGSMAKIAMSRAGQMAVRHYPKLGGWRIVDARRATNVVTRKGPTTSFCAGAERLPRQFPSVDAAIMHAMHLITSQPVLL